MIVNVTTRSYSNLRAGCNDQETRLTSEYVRTNGISHLADLRLDDPRGTEGQPLVVSGVKMRDGSIREVVYIADMSGKAYAFDLNTYELLWKQSVALPVNITKQWDYWMINPKWSTLSTGVVNLETMVWHFVTLSTPDGSMENGAYYFLSLNLADGSEAAEPVPLNDATYQPLGGMPLQRLGSTPRKQRAALTLDTRNGRSTVFVPFGSFLESASSNLGFVLAIDVGGKPFISATWTTGSGKYGPSPGIWQAGQGLSMDEDGFLYGMTGNGAFHPPTGDFGECFVKLKYTPPSGANQGRLECVDWWSPYSDADRKGQDPTAPNVGVAPQMSMAMAMDDMHMDDDMDMSHPVFPTNAMNGMPMVATNRRTVTDQDLGSAAALPIPASLSGYSKSCIIGAGKDGIAYVVDMDNMGKTQNADFAADKIDGNYSKLLSPPWGLTFNGMNVDLAPTDTAMLPILPNGKTAHVHGAMSWYKSPDHGILLYVGGENGPVRAVRLNPDCSLTYMACSQEVASANVGGSGGMPGTMLTLSCDGQGTNTGVLWGLMPYGDANKTITNGRLLGFGANWIDQNGNLIKVFDSEQWGWSFRFNKFCPPTVCNGKVLVPTYDSRVMVLG